MSTTQNKVQEQSKVQGKKQKATAPSDKSPSKLQTLVQYFENARKELAKVSWPTKKEVKVTSLAVVAMIIVMAIFLGITDVILSKLVGFILSLSVRS